MEVDLASLSSEYPLPDGWAPPSVLTHVTRIEKVDIHLAGLSTAHRSGQSVTGSAGQLMGSPLPRAYFELLERVSMVEAANDQDTYLAVRSSTGKPLGTVTRAEAFPSTTDESRCHYARSNGVALGTDWRTAARRAELELVERDRILRSWYGETVPERVGLATGRVPQALERHYRFRAYVFPATQLAGQTAVLGVFAFPRNPSAPLVFGFAARRSRSEAINGALRECLQRLGFLWDEPIPEAPPPFSPTPDFHQEYYLYPPHHTAIVRWLEGGHASCPAPLPRVSPPAARRYVDLTPPALRSKLAIVKALPAGELSLAFGYGHPELASTPEPLAIQPVA